MNGLEREFIRLKKKYDSGGSFGELFEGINILTIDALRIINSGNIYCSNYRHPTKSYIVYQGRFISRPVNEYYFINNPEHFSHCLNRVIRSAERGENFYNIDAETINKVVYTTVMSFACCYDMLKPLSRKTPGTQFEVIIGTFLSYILPHFSMSKQISIPGAEEKITTDIVFDDPARGIGLAIPVKITTRERIVQPFAHQRIMDNVFGEGRYRSIFIGMSETKRDNGFTKVDEICVPGTIKLFNEHLASLTGMYYLDPPARYLNDDIQALLPVRTVGELLHHDLKNILEV